VGVISDGDDGGVVHPSFNGIAAEVLATKVLFPG
jgi:hypothetical protein